MVKLVKINEDGNIVLFKRMNQAVIDEYKVGLNGEAPDISHHKELFEQRYGVKIHYANWGNWTHMEFPSAEAYTLAVLKWM